MSSTQISPRDEGLVGEGTGHGVGKLLPGPRNPRFVVEAAHRCLSNGVCVAKVLDYLGEYLDDIGVRHE